MSLRQNVFCNSNYNTQRRARPGLQQISMLDGHNGNFVHFGLVEIAAPWISWWCLVTYFVGVEYARRHSDDNEERNQSCRKSAIHHPSRAAVTPRVHLPALVLQTFCAY
ncbi:hypothetical protein K439DRAFT_1167110 [Ramaria rubella]|nr:hypothetical protein K439DRAFT_1167110 [Ramaria rubella]